MFSITVDNITKKIQSKERASLKIPTLIVFLSNIPIALIGMYIARKYIVQNGAGESLANGMIQSLFGASAIIVALMTLIGWIIVMGLYYKIIKFFLKEDISIDFRKFFSVCAYIYPFKMLILIVGSIGLLSLLGDYSVGKEFALKWSVAQGRLAILSSLIYPGFRTSDNRI